jgi:ATP-dependent helicase HrpA
MLLNERAAEPDKADYPDQWRQGELTLRLTYQFEPGADADGVTVHIPLVELNQVAAAGFDWQIPGLREDLVTALIRSLPKSVRRNLVPVPTMPGRSSTPPSPLARARREPRHRATGPCSRR